MTTPRRPGSRAPFPARSYNSGFIGAKIFEAMEQKTRQRLIRLGAVLAAAGILVGGYALYKHVREEAFHLNMTVVDPGRLIRTAQPKAGDLEKIREENGLGTILCLRGKEEDSARYWAREHGVEILSLDMRADDPPTDAELGLFFSIMRGDTVRLGNYPEAIDRVVGVEEGADFKFEFPVLIHCQGGADRTGVMVAMYRMAFMGWDAGRAKREMRLHWHFPFAHPRQFEFITEMEGKIGPRHGSRPLPDIDGDGIRVPIISPLPADTAAPPPPPPPGSDDAGAKTPNKPGEAAPLPTD